jgi:hypothetical protein
MLSSFLLPQLSLLDNQPVPTGSDYLATSQIDLSFLSSSYLSKSKIFSFSEHGLPTKASKT